MTPIRRFAKHGVPSSAGKTRGQTSRHGISLVETLFCIVLVSGLLVASLNTVGASAVSQDVTGNGGRGLMLAQDLMGEILQTAYLEPVDTPTFGREGAESGGNRANYDDVDDFHGWNSSPPEYADGIAIPGLGGWRRVVTVDWVNPINLNAAVGIEQGVKRVTVTVFDGARVVATLRGIRSSAINIQQNGTITVSKATQF